MFLFFNEAATSQIYTLSLHDALPISPCATHPTAIGRASSAAAATASSEAISSRRTVDRKSTRLNSSHVEISYAVFCLKKKRIDYVEVTSRSTGSRSPHPAAVEAAPWG